MKGFLIDLNFHPFQECFLMRPKSKKIARVEILILNLFLMMIGDGENQRMTEEIAGGKLTMNKTESHLKDQSFLWEA